jgi:outer membrane assembly lipoprotein YfiO
MKCYSPGQLPVLNALAREFAVLDRWFSSLPGPTWPNRFFAHAASSGGLDHSPSSGEIALWEVLAGFRFEKGTLFDSLNALGNDHAWRIYSAGGFPCVAGLKGITNLEIHDFDDFVGDVGADDYPVLYTFIEPDYGDILANTYRGGSSQHPLDDVTHGEAFIKSVYGEEDEHPTTPRPHHSTTPLLHHSTTLFPGLHGCPPRPASLQSRPMRWTALTKPPLLVGGVLMLLTVGRTAWAAPKTYEYGGGGRWTPAAQTQPVSTEPVINPVLDDAERLLASGNVTDAKQAIVDWLKVHPKALDRDRAIFLLAEADFKLDDRVKAFYQFDELLDTYPASRLFGAALYRQYEIADAFLGGYKRKLFGLPILGAEDEAIDMMFRIQERSPGSPLAEKCLLRTADYYYSSSQFDLASDAYAAYLRSYSRSSEVPRVRLRRAFSSYAQFHGVKFDATPLVDARAQFEDIKSRYPELAVDNNIQKFIDGINETLARKMLVTADFYRRTGEARASVYTLRQLIHTYPSAKEAELAKAELAKMPASALSEPPPISIRPSEPPKSVPPPAQFGPPAPSPK